MSLFVKEIKYRSLGYDWIRLDLRLLSNGVEVWKKREELAFKPPEGEYGEALLERLNVEADTLEFVATDVERGWGNHYLLLNGRIKVDIPYTGKDKSKTIIAKNLDLAEKIPRIMRGVYLVRTWSGWNPKNIMMSP